MKYNIENFEYLMDFREDLITLERMFSDPKKLQEQIRNLLKRQPPDDEK